MFPPVLAALGWGGLAASSLVIGALLAVLGRAWSDLAIGLVLQFGAGAGVSVALLVAIFVSNLPEGIGSASDMRAARRPNGQILRLLIGVAAVCVVATVTGYAVADAVGGKLQGAIDGFAAGALLVMLADSMIPEARRKAGLAGGLMLALGFAVAAGLSSAS
jgi:ZIP family zinc transporter